MSTTTPITARAFLSHSHRDQAVALDLARVLEQRGVQTYTYEYDMGFGEPIVDAIEGELTKSDYVLFLLTDGARRSSWVSRELGLALQLRQASGMTHPAIIGIRTDQSLASAVFDVLDFRTGEPTGLPPHDFATSRWLDYRPHDEAMLEAFVDFLLPKITFIDGDTHSDEELLLDSFACYEDSFPDAAERDQPEDIIEWLEMARHAAENGSPWREVYAVLSIAGRAAGMAFFTAHTRREWSFANYLAVRKGWRQLRRTEWFLKGVADRLREQSPGMKGVVFEIDPIDVSLLQHAAKESAIGALLGQRAIVANLRALRRLNWYQSYHARAIVHSDGQPIEYRQPAMDEASSQPSERVLIPMVKTFDNADLGSGDFRSIIDFLYDDLYGDAYAEGPMMRDGFRDYVRKLKEVAIAQLNHDTRLGPVRMPDAVRDLLNRARREGFLDQLDL